MTSKRVLALALLVPLTVAVTVTIAVASWLVTPGPAKGVAAFSPFSIFRPIWKEQFKQRMLSAMVGDATAAIPSCHTCQLEQCRSGFEEALDRCTRKFEDKIPVVVFNGRSIGSQIGTCTDSEVENTVGPMFPSPQCDDALVRLAHTLGSSKDLRVFSPFLKRFLVLEAAFERDPSLLPRIQELYQVFQRKEVGKLSLLLREIQSPLLQRASLESANVRAIKASFENTLDLFGSSKCARFLEMGVQANGGSVPSSMDFGSLSNTLEAREGLDAALIRSLSDRLEKPWSPEALANEIEPLMQRLPADALAALDKVEQDIKHLCSFGKSLAEAYPSWKEPEQELVARFLVYSLANN